MTNKQNNTIDEKITIILNETPVGKEQRDAIKSLLKAQRQAIIKKLKKRADTLYCTADYLGYHDKNCEGLPCEKIVLTTLINQLTK